MPKKTYVTRKKKPSRKRPGPAPAVSTDTTPNSPARLVWSLIDFETCRPVIRDLGKHVLDSKAHHAVDIAGCLAGVFAYTDENGLKGTLLAMPGMDTEAFIRLVDRGDAEEFTYIVKDGVKEFASVIKEGEA